MTSGGLASALEHEEEGGMVGVLGQERIWREMREKAVDWESVGLAFRQDCTFSCSSGQVTSSPSLRFTLCMVLEQKILRSLLLALKC